MEATTKKWASIFMHFLCRFHKKRIIGRLSGEFKVRYFVNHDVKLINE
jgi:hypothetical protein